MSDYNRTTRECSLQQMRPELSNAIRSFITGHELGDIESEILMAVETTNEKKKKGFFGSLRDSDKDPVHYVGALVTPAWIIWVRSGLKSGDVVSAAKLKDVEVSDFHSDFLEDTGLDLFGFVNQSPERVHSFIGLGNEPSSKKFRETVKIAVARGGNYQLK